MGGFSKVTNFLRDTLTTPTASRPFDEYAELMADLPSILSVNSEAEQSYEMVVPEVTQNILTLYLIHIIMRQ